MNTSLQNRINSRQKPLTFLLVLILAGLLSGCASGGSKNAAIIGGSALGSFVAHEASDGDAAWTAGGVALGGLTAIAGNAIAVENERVAYRGGYEAGMNQSVKQQYWIIQNRQREDAFTDQSEQGSFVPIKVPEQEINGEIKAERIVYLRSK